MGEFIVLVALLGYIGGTAVVACAISWRFLADYASWFRRRKQPRAPSDWQRLATGDIPLTSQAKVATVKGKLTNSCEIHGKCVPRCGWYGTVSHPLSLDE